MRCIALALLLVSVTGACLADVNGTKQDDEAIKRVIVEMTEGFNRHDAEAATRMYTADAEFVSVRGEVGYGRAAAESGLRRIFETRARNALLNSPLTKSAWLDSLPV